MTDDRSLHERLADVHPMDVDPVDPERDDLESGVDFVDPLKRGPGDDLPGLDPVVSPIPPD